MTILVDVVPGLVAVMTGVLTMWALRAALVWYMFEAALPAGLLAAARMWMGLALIAINGAIGLHDRKTAT